MNLTHSELAKSLGVSRQYTGKLVQKGMPTTSVKAAKEWQATHCPHAGIRTGNQGATREATKGGNQTVEFQSQVPLVDAEGETLEESIERLRQIEKSLGVARGTRWSFSSCNTITSTLLKRGATMESAERSMAFGGHRSNDGSGLGAWLTRTSKVC